MNLNSNIVMLSISFPILLKNLFQTSEIWSLQFNLLSIMRPRIWSYILHGYILLQFVTHYDLVYVSYLLLTYKLFPLCVVIICLFWATMISGSVQSSNFLVQVSSLYPKQIKLVSAANEIVCWETLVKSFLYNENKRGPKMVLGELHIWSLGEEDTPLYVKMPLIFQVAIKPLQCSTSYSIMI